MILYDTIRGNHYLKFYVLSAWNPLISSKKNNNTCFFCRVTNDIIIIITVIIIKQIVPNTEWKPAFARSMQIMRQHRVRRQRVQIWLCNTQQLQLLNSFNYFNN